MSDEKGNEPDNLEDDWAAALAAQGGSEPEPVAAVAEPPPAATPHRFASLAEEPRPTHGKTDIDMIMDVPVQLTAELGRTRITIKHLLQLSQGSVVELDGLAGEPMDIFINGFLIAQGEVVVVNDKFGIRLTDIITPSERIHKLNR